MSYCRPAEPDDRHGLSLKEVAALSLELARDLQARALATEDDHLAAELAGAFHKVTRGLRQTLALDLRVIGFRHELARQAPDFELRQKRAREDAAIDLQGRDDHVENVRQYVEPVIWNEREHEAGVALQCRFRTWLDLTRDTADFLHTRADDLAEQACHALGLDPALMEEDEEDKEAAAKAPAQDAAATPERPRLVHRLTDAGPPDSS